MSNYTTQLRYVCASLAKIDNTNPELTIPAAWPIIFKNTIDTYDPNYKDTLCTKILRHYYMCEIGVETVELFIFYMRNTFNEIMPYYNQLYESAAQKYDLFNDVKWFRTINSKDSSTSESGSSSTTIDTTTKNNTTTTKDKSSDTQNGSNLFSDTPQGGLDNIKNNGYLTNATITNSAGTKSTDTSITNNGVDNKSVSASGDTSSSHQSDSKTVESLQGKQGTQSYPSLIAEARSLIINIDLMIINDFAKNFMEVW